MHVDILKIFSLNDLDEKITTSSVDTTVRIIPCNFGLSFHNIRFVTHNSSRVNSLNITLYNYILMTYEIYLSLRHKALHS